jgi:hypothetical protein
MKKIMFNDKYGLTAAVLNGKKTMTRRSVPAKLLQKYGHNKFNDRSKDLIFDAQFSIGEVVAVAQRYSDIADDKFFVNEIAADELTVNAMKYEHGWNNKQGVKACYMPHRIRITDIKIERLQDISEEDVYKEGFTHEFVNNNWGNSAYHEETMLVYYDNKGLTKQIRSREPKEAFSFLIDKVSGNGTWERNPWVFVYTFELID